MVRKILFTFYGLFFFTLVHGQKISFKADEDHEFDNSSGIIIDKLDNSKVENLQLLGQVWGFLKYYHPSIAAGQYNWDYELFRTLPKILQSRNIIERDSILIKWIKGLGSFDLQENTSEFNDQAKIIPDLKWIDNPEIGENLRNELNRTKRAVRKNNHYYIEFIKDIGNPNFKNERSYEEMKFPDDGYRLLALYRYWNIIQYYFPYRNLLDDDWNLVLKQFIPKFIASRDELEYKLTILDLIGKVHDTHANIWNLDETLRRFKGLRYPPFETSIIDNKAVVWRFYNDSIGPKSGLMKGDIIISVNGTPIEAIISERLNYYPASNYSTQLRDIEHDLLRTNDSILNIKYLHLSDTLVSNLTTFTVMELKVDKELYGVDTCFKILDNDIAYIFPGELKNAYLPRIFKKIKNTKGLIIDFRCYPSDFLVFSLSDYLLPQSKPFVKFSNGSITTPGLFTYTTPLSVGRKNKNFYKGKVVIIINEKTQSSAEYHTMAFSTSPNSTVIGSTTAAADGNVSIFYLPGGVKTMISGIGVYYPDGKETQRIGIVPNIEVKPTIEGIKQGKDELLEKAIDIIRQN